MMEGWLQQLAAVGWRIPVPEWDPDSDPLKLPCGPVVWIAGPMAGVLQDAWLGIEDGIVRLHGCSAKDDCDVTEFCRRLTEQPTVEREEQGRLFE